MSYTTVWDESIPSGSTTQSSDIDTVFQNLRRDIRERMNSIVVDWAADPITLLLKSPEILYKVANVSVTGTTDTVIATYTVPANKIQNIGDQLLIRVYGHTILGGIIYILFGGATLALITPSSVASPGGGWRIDVDIALQASSYERVVTTTVTNNTAVRIDYMQPDPTIDTSVNANVDVHVIGSAGGSSTRIIGMSIIKI